MNMDGRNEFNLSKRELKKKIKSFMGCLFFPSSLKQHSSRRGFILYNKI